MAISSRIKKVGGIIWRYILSKTFLSLVLAYMVISVILLTLTGIDICIPCIFSTLTGYHCPGCGLTTATIDLLQLHFVSAWDHNPMVFAVLPAGAYFAWADFSSFLRARMAAQTA
jgi:hypothetical protein